MATTTVNGQKFEELGVVVGAFLVETREVKFQMFPDENGYLGPLRKNPIAQTNIRLVIKVPDAIKDSIHGFMVDNPKNVTQKSNDSKKDGRKGYALDIQVKWSQKAKCYHTEHPFNKFIILKILGNTVEMWEVSVTSQSGKFFLNIQKIYTWLLFRQSGWIVTYDQSLIDWPQMREQIDNIFKDTIADLPHVDNLSAIRYHQRVEREKTKAPETFADQITGRVAWFNLAKGLGVINTGKGQARVHWSQVIKSDKDAKRYLIEGQLVTFERLAEPNANPNQPTTFPFEAYGVVQSKN